MFWNEWFTPKPFNDGYLPEKGGHSVYYAQYGNPQGQPVLMFHGGPGGSSRAKNAKIADLKKYRVIMFDQRGCGKSLPLGEVNNNTTPDLLDDVTRLLEHLNVTQKIIIVAASWGSTLALLWAEKHPEQVEELLLSQIFLANEECRLWEFEDCAYFFPEFVEQMNHISQDNISQYYNQLIQSDEEEKQLEAVNYYGCFERICSNLNPKFGNSTQLSQEELASNRIFMHYAAHKFFLGANTILDNISKIKEIPTTIIHNRLDMVCPYKGAYDLQKQLVRCRLITVPEFGHTGKKIRKIKQKTFKCILDNKI